LTPEAAAAQQLVILTGLFSLGGVVIGALLSPLTQLFVDWRRRRRMADRAKALVAGELLHCQLIMRTTVDSGIWPIAEDADTARGRLPSTMWEENRSELVGEVDDDLLNALVMAYATLDVDRGRMVLANKVPERRLTEQETRFFQEAAAELGRLRRRLGAGGGWVEDTQ